jgi:Family of unknown function (DUF6292)
VPVRFAEVGDQQQILAAHAGYIDAIRRRLEEQEITVTLARTGSRHGVRTAELHIHPAADIAATAVPDEAFLAWDEERGWSFGLSRDPARLAPLSPVHKGLGVLPDPEDVASWVMVLLTHPELTPSREDHPFRDHAVEDPEFEAQLVRYTPGR